MFKDIEDIGQISNISKISDKRANISKFVPEDNEILMKFVIDLEKNVEDTFKISFTKLTRKYSILPSKRSMSMMYQYLVKNNIIEKNKQFESYIVKKPSKSWSGVIVITIVMRPDQFSCPENCSYCPNQTKKNGALVDMPRSYLDSEPAVKRAVQHDFDTSAQFFSRVKTLEENGHTIDKAEIILEGGTFSSYSRKYQVELMRDIYYSANTYFAEGEKRYRLSLEEEITINESAKLKIIGITIETRPDHINDDVLDGVNRNHKVEHSIKAIKDCKNCGFKVDIHVMPDLPGTTFAKDMYMVEHILTSQDFMADYIKWYPCLDVDFTEIREWKKSGKWVPWADSDNGEKILQLGLKIKEFSKEYIRYNRIQRDFPEEHGNVVGYSSSNIKSNFRQVLQNEMKRRGLECKCIRCREVKDRVSDIELKTAFLKIETYNASGGLEYFISYNSPDNKLLYGFVRLRVLHEENNYFPELAGCALIRELHVYGSLKAVYDKTTKNTVQHYGFGKKMVDRAEIIAKSFGYKKIAIISGVGVRNYYRNIGYTLQGSGQYMIKELVDENKRSYEILDNIMYKYTDKICSVIYIISLIYTLYFMIIDKVDKS